MSRKIEPLWVRAMAALKNERKRQGLSQREVAARMRCNPAKVSKMENSGDGLLLDLRKYSRAFGLTSTIVFAEPMLLPVAVFTDEEVPAHSGPTDRSGETARSP